MEMAPMDETSPQNRYQGAVRESIQKTAKRNSAYMLMNTLTTVIACYGLFANSAAIMNGAMIVAMFWGPISGVSLGLVDSDKSLLKNSVFPIAGYGKGGYGPLDTMPRAQIVAMLSRTYRIRGYHDEKIGTFHLS
jgi:hypothetical protein